MLKNIVVGGILCAAMVRDSIAWFCRRSLRGHQHQSGTATPSTPSTLQKNNLKAAKDAFASFDSAWDGSRSTSIPAHGNGRAP